VNGTPEPSGASIKLFNMGVPRFPGFLGQMAIGYLAVNVFPAYRSQGYTKWSPSCCAFRSAVQYYATGKEELVVLRISSTFYYHCCVAGAEVATAATPIGCPSPTSRYVTIVYYTIAQPS
jgi:hypothetical protein